MGRMMGRSHSQRGYNKLSARKVETLTEPGRHSDGRNLYLIVDPSGAKRWVFMFRWKRPGAVGSGKMREMGLGPLTGVNLQRAREKAEEARALLADGIDPIAHKRSFEAIPTFGDLVDVVIEEQAPGVRSEKSVDRWKRLLKVHAAALGPLRVDTISVDDVLSVVRPLWTTNPDTAKLMRGYIERTLDAAKVKGFRSGENPARWRGHLERLLPKPQKLIRGHHKAMAFEEVPAFIGRLRTKTSIPAQALEFLILTAARSGEVMGAVWSEIDLAKKVWTIPGPRMKAGKEHQVPLCPRALAILAEMAKLRVEDSDIVFHGAKPGHPLSTMAFGMLLRRMDLNVTAHGFRSSFRDWAGEKTNFPRDLAEQALAHAVGDDTERAYRRMQGLERRRKMMMEWESFCLRLRKPSAEAAE